MKKALKLSLVLLFISQFSFAQSFSIDGGINAGGHQYSGISADAASYISKYDSNLKNVDLSHTNLSGSIYINNEFSLAKLSNVESDLKVRYDAYNDEMELDCVDDVRYLLKTHHH